MASKLDNARRALQRAREKARSERREMMRRAWSGGAAYALGSLERSGALESIPTPWGLPRTVVLAAVGIVGGQYASGLAGDALDGLGDAALAVAAYQLGSTGRVSGDESAPPLTPYEELALPTMMDLEPVEGLYDDYEDELDSELEEPEVSDG